MPRFKVTVEYEGTRYSGWQVQKNARTVQGELHSALGKVFGPAAFEFYGSGRTDAGVHALGQVAHLDVQTVLGPEIIRLKTNDVLPPDINIIEVEKAARRFTPGMTRRPGATSTRFRGGRTAFGKRYVWWVKDKLDTPLMRWPRAHFTA